MKQIIKKFRCWEPGIRQMGLVKVIIFNGKEAEQIHLFDGGTTDIKSAVLMQYTGLKDKNGVDIYEEDIVKYNNGFIEEVGKLDAIDPALTHEGLLESDTDEICEVIGNIYENPELLK